MEIFAHVTLTPHRGDFTKHRLQNVSHTYIFLPAAVPLLKPILPPFFITPQVFASNNVKLSKSKRSLPPPT